MPFDGGAGLPIGTLAAVELALTVRQRRRAPTFRPEPLSTCARSCYPGNLPNRSAFRFPASRSHPIACGSVSRVMFFTSTPREAPLRG